MNGSGQDARREATIQEIEQAVWAILSGEDGEYGGLSIARGILAGTRQANYTLHDLQACLVAYGGHGLATPDLDASSESRTKIKTPTLRMGAGTPLACTQCHRIDMPVYYLKRANAKYDVLCSDCYAHSSRSLCTYIDRDEAQCMDLAEFIVVYGQANDLMRRAVCSRHVPAVLGGAPVYVLYPLDSEYLESADVV